MSLSGIREDNSNIDNEVRADLRRNDERKTFNKFLVSRTSVGSLVIDKIIESAKERASSLLENGESIPNQTLFDYAVLRLKTRLSGNLSVYDSVIRKIIEDQNPEFKSLHREVDRGTFDGKLPFGYPDASKNAAGILEAKIKDKLPTVKDSFLEQKVVAEKIRELTRKMFFGVNKLGLSGENLVNYLGILFELESIQTAPVEGFDLLTKYISSGCQNALPIEFYYIKCLRFSYPNGARLKIITHLGAEDVRDKLGGIFLSTDETGMSKSIGDFERIFINRGLRVRSTILVADNDLSDNFPGDFGDIIPGEDVKRADHDAEIYLDNLKANLKNSKVIRLTSLIDELGKRREYENIRTTVMSSLRHGDGKFVSEKVIEGLIEYRFDRDKAIFEKSTREIARERVYRKMASQIAIQVLASEGRLLVTNSHGNENGLIAGNRMPIIFTDIYREEKVFENV